MLDPFLGLGESVVASEMKKGTCMSELLMRGSRVSSYGFAASMIGKCMVYDPKKRPSLGSLTRALGDHCLELRSGLTDPMGNAKGTDPMETANGTDPMETATGTDSNN